MTPELESALVAKVLAHPTRIKILEAMKTVDKASPSDLAEGRADPNDPDSYEIAPIGEPLGNVSYHMKKLLELGALKAAGTMPRRGAVEHYYRATGKVSLMSDANLALDAIAEVARAEPESDVAIERVRDILAEAGREAEFRRAV